MLRLPTFTRVARIASLAAMASARADAGFVVFEAAGPDPASIAPTRDAFRATIGGGAVAGPDGSFGGLRREINWDGVPDSRADPNPLPGDFFAARGAEFGTPGTGFLVSANSGQATLPLFGFPSDFQAFSAQRLFTAVNSNVTDVTFVVPGTTTAATTTAFGLVFVDVEVAGSAKIEFFDAGDKSIFSRDVPVAGNQGLTFVGGVADAGELISRVRITSGSNTIVSNGVLGDPTDDVVVMDDFLYAEPLVAAVPEPTSLVLAGLGLGLVAALACSRRRAG